MVTPRRLEIVLASAKRLLRVGAFPNLLNLLQKQHPVDLASILSALNEHERQAAFRALASHDARLAMQALAELALIDCLPSDPARQVREIMAGHGAGGVDDLLAHTEGTAGRIMNPRVVALAEDATAGDAVRALQESGGIEMVFYVYVLDARQHLVGVVSLRRLLLVPLDTPLKRIMTSDVISAHVDDDQTDVARKVSSYHLLAIPVVVFGTLVLDEVSFGRMAGKSVLAVAFAETVLCPETRR